MSIPPASLFHSLSASFVEETDTLNQTGYTTEAEIVVLTKVVNGKHYKMQQMFLACNLRYYELWRLLQLYAVVFWRWPKQPHLWESLSQESKKLRLIKKATMPTLWGLIPMSHHMLKLVLLLWHEATQLNGGVCTETLFDI